MHTHTIARRFSFTLAVAGLVLFTLLGASPASAGNVPFQTISSAGPLSDIYLGDELSCQIAHTADTAFEFYPPGTAPGDCGTFLVVNDVLYAPDFASHNGSATGSLGTYTPFTPVSQSTVTGSGTSVDPYQVVTVADAGATGLRITQTDSYVVGLESYRTDTQISNTGGSSQSLILYRAADCYLGGSDSGYGFVVTATGAVACSINPDNTPPDRIEQWLPITGGNDYYQDGYSEVWSAISTHASFPNTCDCSSQIDNGAGISWSFSIPSGGQATRSHLTTFSPTGELPLTVTKAADSATSSQGAANGYTITVSNPNVTAVNVDSITDTLPTGFAYTAGSTTGVTTADPAIAGDTFTWSGPFSAPGSGSISLHFEVTVSSVPGEYFNRATADAGTFTVAPTGDTAPVTITAASAPTPTPTATTTGTPQPTPTPTATATLPAPTDTPVAPQPTPTVVSTLTSEVAAVTLPAAGAGNQGSGGPTGWLIAALLGSAALAAAGYGALRLRRA